MEDQSKKDRFDFVDRVFCKLDDKVSATGVDSLNAEERVVYFVWAALGVLGNGSFQYFFENNMDADATAASFQELGLPAPAECFRLAQSLLPSEYLGADWDRQLELLKEHETSLDTLAQKVLADRKRSESRLADYILAHPNLATLTDE